MITLQQNNYLSSVILIMKVRMPGQSSQTVDVQQLFTGYPSKQKQQDCMSMISCIGHVNKQC